MMKPDKNNSGNPGIIVHDWSLLAGYHVHITLDHVHVRSGKVEEALPDGQALWLASGGGFGRQLIDQGSGYAVFLEPDQHAIFRKRRADRAALSVTPESVKKR